MRPPRILTLIVGLVAAAHASGVVAKDDVDLSATVETRAVYSDRAVLDGDDVEASGAGIAAEAGFVWRNGRTAVQFDLGATVFDFSDDSRDTRTGVDAAAAVATALTDTLTVTATVAARDDLVTLESRRTDQVSVGAALAFEQGDTRLRAGVEQRWRRYAGATSTTGEGLRIDAQANRRLGPYHWARLDLRVEDIDSDDSVRGYERQTARLSYSRPVAGGRKLRLRPALTYTQWRYDSRFASDPADGIRRRDSYWQPEIGLAYGRDTGGWQGRLRAAYQLRHSNDPAYRADAPFAELRVGYRF